MQDQMKKVLEQAARLQRIVPDAILVGGTASYLYAEHRFSNDHDHIITDLEARFNLILESLEREGDWITNRLVYGKIILGELGGIEAGIRQLIRKKPLEFQKIKIGDIFPDNYKLSGNSDCNSLSGKELQIPYQTKQNLRSISSKVPISLNVPTIEEITRIKAYLIVKRNQMRDYLDFAALSDKMGILQSAQVLENLDEYYSDDSNHEKPVLSQLLRQLSNPQPADYRSIDQLSNYKGTVQKWKDWDHIMIICKQTAQAVMEKSYA